MVRSRIFGILAGYEDQNDHDTLLLRKRSSGRSRSRTSHVILSWDSVTTLPCDSNSRKVRLRGLHSARRTSRPERRTPRYELTWECPAEAREGKIRSTAMLPAVDQHNMAGLRLPSCQNVKRVVEWLVIHRAAQLCRSAGGASLRTHQLTDPATVIT
jgi:hypothetical protein